MLLTGISIAPEARQEVALLASVPLSPERWEPLVEGEVVVLREGRVVRRELPGGAGAELPAPAGARAPAVARTS